MLQEAIFNIQSPSDFDTAALEVFRFQYKNNTIYNTFCNHLNIQLKEINSVKDIPFLPIQFFKSHKIITRNTREVITFSSSGTTGNTTSKHYVSDLNIYQKSFRNCFQQFYGPITDYVILGLLPSYLEREGSSLIYMVNDLINNSKQPLSGFYLNNVEALVDTLNLLQNKKQKTLLIGVSYALLDLVEKYNLSLNDTIIMETGGMKGRRKELIREALHNKLKKGFGVHTIHSEYGMTELLSQAYSKKNGVFICPTWMQVFIRDPEDALTIQDQKSGGLNIIDLANINSCSFIATQDLGKKFSDGSFEILGRFDNSDIRGCNLMIL